MGRPRSKKKKVKQRGGPKVQHPVGRSGGGSAAGGASGGADAGAGSAQLGTVARDFDWQASITLAVKYHQELNTMCDYQAYARIHDDKPDKLFILKGGDGKAKKMAVKQSRLRTKKMTLEAFYASRQVKIQDCLQKIITLLRVMLAQIETSEVLPLVKIAGGRLVRADDLFLNAVIRLDVTLTQLHGNLVLKHQLFEVLLLDVIHYISSIVDLSASCYERVRSKLALYQGVSFTLLISVLEQIVNESYIDVISWGDAVKIGNPVIEQAYALDLAWLLICRLALLKLAREFASKDHAGVALQEFLGFMREQQIALSELKPDELAQKLKVTLAEYSRAMASLSSGTSLHTVDLGSLVRLIYVFPNVLGVTPHEHFAFGASDPLMAWVAAGPSRISVYYRQQKSHFELLREEQRKYIKSCVDAAHEKARQQEALSERLRAIAEAVPDEDIAEEEKGSGGAARVSEQKRMFPYLPDFERQCVQLHLDLIGLSAEVKKRLSHAIKFSKPLNFEDVNRLLTEMTAAIRSIPDIDANHRAQKAIFLVGCYLQFLRGHLPYLGVLESQLEQVNHCTTQAMDEVLAISTVEGGIAQEYVDTLNVVLAEVKDAEKEYMQLAVRVYQRNQQKKAVAALRRKQRGERSHYKPREDWDPRSRTSQTIEKLGLVERTKATSGLFKPAASEPRREVLCQVDEATAMLISVDTVPALAQSTLQPTSWLRDNHRDEVGSPEELVIDDPVFLQIMQALTVINPELADCVRVRGGALRDYLLKPDEKPNDWDLEAFCTYEELVELLPPEYVRCLSSPILHVDGAGKPVMMAKLSVFIGDAEYEFDITLNPCRPSEREYAMSQPSNADYNPNGLYSYKRKDGKHVILNHEGSARAKDVMRTCLAPVSTISHASLHQDPILILRGLRLLGEYKLPISEMLEAELLRVGETFALGAYSKDVQEHFSDVFERHQEHIMAAPVLSRLPALQEALDELVSRELGIESFRAMP